MAQATAPILNSTNADFGTCNSCQVSTQRRDQLVGYVVATAFLRGRCFSDCRR